MSDTAQTFSAAHSYGRRSIWAYCHIHHPPEVSQIGDPRPQYAYHNGHQQQYPTSNQLSNGSNQPRTAATTNNRQATTNSNSSQTENGFQPLQNGGHQENHHQYNHQKTSPERMIPAIKGWLYKRGNDGLKLWKKRYFVLTDYKLSYYKTPHEEKSSGSILLPSYRISPVSKDDGIPRKFAFKAEHQNMRTYYFAADSKANMIQWMNALSLASILQSDRSFMRPKKKVPQQAPLNNNTAEYRYSQQYETAQNSSPNFHCYPPAVYTMHGSSGNAYVNSNSIQAYPPGKLT